MKKMIFVMGILIVLSLCLVGCGKTKEKESTSQPQYAFYKRDKEKRYQDYQKQNPDLSWKDVLLRVNIGLDQPYYTNTQESKHLYSNYVLVNKYTYLKEDYIPKNLVVIDSAYSKGGISLSEEAQKSFEEMASQAKEDGYTIRAISAYRSYDYQVQLYRRYVEQDGVEEADTYSARPGFSEHQTGLCVDIDDGVFDFNQFESSKSFDWMMENAYLYGFILRYPKGKEAITGYQYEAWHYRYVGKKIAQYIKEHDLVYDEYYMEFLDK